MQIEVYSAYEGNIFVLDLGKLWKQYEEKSYHAVFQQQYYEIKTDFLKGSFVSFKDFKTRPLCNSWGDYEKEISFSEAEKAI